MNTQLSIAGLSISSVNDVYMLMNAYAPADMTNIAKVEFIGTGGADQQFTLVAGTDIRDFCVNTLPIRSMAPPRKTRSPHLCRSRADAAPVM